MVEVVSGQTLDTFFAEHILQPLEMHDTAFEVPPAKLGRFGKCYVYDPKGGLPEFPADFAAGTVDTLSGGGGLISTGHDYIRFAEMLRRGGALGDVRLLGPPHRQADDVKPSARRGGPCHAWSVCLVRDVFHRCRFLGLVLRSI